MNKVPMNLYQMGVLELKGEGDTVALPLTQKLFPFDNLSEGKLGFLQKIPTQCIGYTQRQTHAQYK